MCSNHADASRQAQTAQNRRRRLRTERILVAVLAPILAGPALAESKRDALSLSPPVIPGSPRPAASRIPPPAKISLQELGDGSYPRTHYQRALYLRQKGDLDGALIEFLKATQVNPRLVRAFYEQALIFRERHYLKLAESALQQALAVKPDYQPARILLATVRLEQGNLTGAVSELSRSLGLAQPRTSSVPAPAEPSQAGTMTGPAPPPHAPSLMQTPHNLLPEPPAPPPASPSFDPPAAEFKEAPADTSSAEAAPDKKVSATREPFVLEGMPAGPARTQARAGAGGKRGPAFWQRALPGTNGNRPSAPGNRLPFAGNLPGFDFRLHNPFNLFKKDPQAQAKRQTGDLQPAPPAQTAADLPPVQLPAPPAAPELQPPGQVPGALDASPQQTPAPPSQMRKTAAAPPANTAARTQKQKAEPGWLDRVLAGVMELSGAALGTASTARPRVESARPVEPRGPAARPRQEESIEPLQMVIRQPPAPESRVETAQTGEPVSEPRPQPQPVARAVARAALPAPRGPSERSPQTTLPAPLLVTASPRPAAAPLPERPVVASAPAAFLGPSVVPRQVNSPAPALPAAPTRVAQPAAQPSAMPRTTGSATPVSPPARNVNQPGLLPPSLSPAPLSFAGDDNAPTPRQSEREPVTQPAVLPNRIQQQRDPFMPVRAVGRPVNPLAILFGSEPGPRPTPPQRVETRQSPQPSTATLPAQIPQPPVVNRAVTPETPPYPVAVEAPRLVQHPAQPSALPRATAAPPPLPNGPQRVVNDPVQPAIISQTTVTAPMPPSEPLRTQRHASVPQTVTSPTPLAFAGSQPVPAPTQPEQRLLNDQTVKPSRLDAPRTAMVPINAVGRRPAPEPQTASPAPSDPFMPLPAAPDPEVPLRIAPPSVERSSHPAQPAAQAASSTFAYAPGSQSRLLAMADSARLPAAYLSSPPSARPAPPPPPASTIQLDDVGKRMKYLAEHGTASLKEGEAFMFSEETGEAVLFQASGQTLRRKIAEPQDGQEVVKNRRPDLQFPQELRYNLSLLAKLLPHQEEPKPQPPAQAPAPTFTLNELMAKPDGMFGWLKQLFRM